VIFDLSIWIKILAWALPAFSLTCQLPGYETKVIVIVGELVGRITGAVVEVIPTSGTALSTDEAVGKIDSVGDSLAFIVDAKANIPHVLKKTKRSKLSPKDQ